MKFRQICVKKSHGTHKVTGRSTNSQLTAILRESNDCWNPYNCPEVSLLLLQGVTLWLLFITIYAGYHYTVIKRTFNNNYIITICDVMARNQSHVAKHKRAEICILSENVKLYPFFVFIKTKYLCKFLSLKLIFAPFSYIFHVFFSFLRKYI